MLKTTNNTTEAERLSLGKKLRNFLTALQKINCETDMSYCDPHATLFDALKPLYGIRPEPFALTRQNVNNRHNRRSSDSSDDDDYNSIHILRLLTSSLPHGRDRRQITNSNGNTAAEPTNNFHQDVTPRNVNLRAISNDPNKTDAYGRWLCIIAVDAITIFTLYSFSSRPPLLCQDNTISRIVTSSVFGAWFVHKMTALDMQNLFHCFMGTLLQTLSQVLWQLAANDPSLMHKFNTPHDRGHTMAYNSPHWTDAKGAYKRLNQSDYIEEVLVFVRHAVPLILSYAFFSNKKKWRFVPLLIHSFGAFASAGFELSRIPNALSPNLSKTLTNISPTVHTNSIKHLRYLDSSLRDNFETYGKAIFFEEIHQNEAAHFAMDFTKSMASYIGARGVRASWMQDESSFFTELISLMQKHTKIGIETQKNDDAEKFTALNRILRIASVPYTFDELFKIICADLKNPLVNEHFFNRRYTQNSQDQTIIERFKTTVLTLRPTFEAFLEFYYDRDYDPDLASAKFTEIISKMDKKNSHIKTVEEIEFLNDIDRWIFKYAKCAVNIDCDDGPRSKKINRDTLMISGTEYFHDYGATANK